MLYITLPLTFADLHAINPLVVHVSIAIADTSTVLKPSTARSAATISAGFPERAAFGTRHRLSDRRGDGWRPGYQPSVRY